MRVNVDMSINSLVDDLNSDNNNDDNNDNNNDTSINKKWQPKQWKIEYEKIVMMDLMGLKGYEIAERIGCTPQHVYNILGTDQAVAIQKSLINRVRKEALDMTQEIKEIQELTVTRLKKCLKDDDIFNESRLGFITRGIDVMKGTGEYLKNAPTNQVNNQFILPPSIADRFLEGLEKSDKARELLAGRDVTKLIESNNE